MISIVLSKIKQFAGSYHGIFFLGDPICGLVLFGLTWMYPNIALCGLISWLIAWLCVRVLDSHRGSPAATSALLNALLVGLFLGYLFRLDGIVLFLCTMAAILTVLISFGLEGLLRTLSLPLLSLPFTLVAICVSLASPSFSNLSDGTAYFSPAFSPELPVIVKEFLISVGAILCIPDPVFGGALLGVIALFSPLTSLFLATGFLVGYGSEALLTLSRSGTQEIPFSHHFFNYSLIFTAIAGYFFLPNRTSMLLGATMTCASVLFSEASIQFLKPLGVSFMTLPFNIVVMLTLRAFMTARPAWVLGQHGKSPEGALETARLYQLSHGGGEVGIFCPVGALSNGLEWRVQQGFNGSWTHVSYWRHALDFVVYENDQSDAKTHRDQGIELEDYFAFGKRIVSPVEGTVVSLCSSLEDNPIGKVENTRNWGNYIVLRSVGGIYVLIAHLKKDSISVKVGEYILVGKELAQCGNSGYSQEPHVHVQVQWSADPGAYTVPFHLLNFVCQGIARFHYTPNTGDRIHPFELNLALDRVLSFTIGQEQKWRQGKKQFFLKSCLDSELGALYWTDGVSRIYYTKSGGQFYFYGLESRRWSPLWDLYASCPRVPVAFGEDFRYQEYFPLRVTHGPITRFVALGYQMLTNRFAGDPGSFQFRPESLEITGSVGGLKTYCKLDPQLGWTEYRVGDRHYVRES